MRRLVLVAGLCVAVAACSNSDPIKPPNNPPPVSTTTIHYSTYVGDELQDAVRDVAIDAAGNTYLVGGAFSQDLLPGAPVRAFTLDPQDPNDPTKQKEEAFAAKLDAAGNVVWWTFLGGAGPDRAFGVDVASNGDVVVGGSAAEGFPVTAGALLTTFQGGAGDCDDTQLPTNTTTDVPAGAKCDKNAADPARDGFVARLNGTSGALLWATYFGSGTFEADSYEQRLHCRPATTSGGTTTNGLPYTTDDAITDFNDDNDTRSSVVRDVAVDPATGVIYLTFSVQSSLARLSDPDRTILPQNAGTGDALCDDDPNAPNGTTVPGIIRNLPAVILTALQNGDQPNSPALDTGNSNRDGILARLTGDGTALDWATFVGGRGEESDEMFVRVDPQGNPVVLLATSSTERDEIGGNRVTAQDPVTKAVVTTEPITANGFDGVHDGADDFYVAKYASNGPLLWATYLGGESTELLESGGLAVRADGAIVVAGTTFSANLATAGGWDRTFNGGVNGTAFGGDCGVAVFDGNASALTAATFYGGVSGDGCTGVASDGNLNVYVTGGTTSIDLAIRSGPHQTQLPGARSAFLAVFGSDLSTLRYSGYFGGTGLGHSNAMALRSDTASSGRVVFAGESQQGYPLSATPARGTVTAPPAHGVVTEATLGF